MFDYEYISHGNRKFEESVKGEWKERRRKEGDRKEGRDGGKGLYFGTYVKISAWPTHSPGPSALTQDPCQ